MQIHIIGDNDYYIATPVRLSEKAEVGGNEKLWATLDVEPQARFFKAFHEKFGNERIKDGVYRSSAQKVIEWMKSKFDEGELSNSTFELKIFDWPIERTVTTFSRTAR